MKTYKIKAELFSKIAGGVDFDNVWRDILEYEHEITGGQLLPRLAGGLSHYVWTNTKIEIHDIGMVNGSYVQDKSFRIIPEVDVERKKNRGAVKEKIEIENNNIIDYLCSEYGRCLKVAHVEKLCKVPKNTIQNIANGHRKLSVNNISKIVNTFKIFGYEPIFDWVEII